MNYNNMMEDCILYMNHHSEELMTAESLGHLYSCRGEYLGYFFGCYYEETLDVFLKRIREKQGNFVYPKEREKDGEFITITNRYIDGFTIKSVNVVEREEEQYYPIEVAVKKSKMNYDENASWLALWWHDEEYRSHYMQGTVGKFEGRETEEMVEIFIPSGNYVVFSLALNDKLDNPAEAMKKLIHYCYGQWRGENQEKTDELAYCFQYFEKDKVYFCMELLEENKREREQKEYGIEHWTKYIDDNITRNLSTTSLARQFSYSPTHFKRIFRFYYKMSVSDYIRKRRLTAMAEEIRGGKAPQNICDIYGFRTYAGFAKAFKKEFHISPSAYSKGTFEVIDLVKFYKEYKDTLKLSIVQIDPIHMIGHTVIPANGEEVDIAAWVNYWLGREFPCMQNVRFEFNVERREDKIALWYSGPETSDVEYILGPVVDEFSDDIPKEMKRVTLEGGKYAIFETDKMSDEDDVSETLRMYARCVFFGWVKEHRKRVDLSRITFERYVNRKIYLYVPVMD